MVMAVTRKSNILSIPIDSAACTLYSVHARCARIMFCKLRSELLNGVFEWLIYAIEWGSLGVRFWWASGNISMPRPH